MKNVFCSLLLILSTQAFAKNAVQTMLEEKSGLSPYEILSQFHNSEGTSVSLSELNTIDLDTQKITTQFTNCAMALAMDLVPRNTDFLIFKKTKTIPAIPPQGPLFPGTPEMKVVRSSLALNIENLNTPPYILEYVLDSASWDLTKSDSTIFNNSYQGFGDYNYNHSAIRKHGDLISFLIYSARDGAYDSTTAAYGYCWNE